MVKKGEQFCRSAICKISQARVGTFDEYVLGWVMSTTFARRTVSKKGDIGQLFIAFDGVVVEPINLTVPVTQAIATTFTSWLVDKETTDSSKTSQNIYGRFLHKSYSFSWNCWCRF
ncbi:hypothetical protein M8C21_007240 [Ambrosia artemisiifolia]|uniref:Uncharacterized protein n=1 Tax=Ambrosia artemisiifolia TaxID=4212 RepID=A0AAD5C1G1_AMBAR|nr:hypothetical protein M8C21_007240 [Ambrosia artemisiifolia]